MLSFLVELYRYALEPIPPFTWLGVGISTLDVVAMIRLCIVLRQIRESSMNEYIKSQGKSIEEASFLKKAAATLVVVYGGEAIIGAIETIAISYLKF